MNPEYYEIPEGDQHRREVLDFVLTVSQAIVDGSTPAAVGAADIWQRCTFHYDIPEVLEFMGCVSEMEPGKEDSFEHYEAAIRRQAQEVVDGVSESFRSP